jgi:hypothetical protein
MSILEQLSAPFDPDRVSWRVGATSGDKSKGLALAYIDARDVMQRLDEVAGAGWQCTYPHAGTKTVCSIGIKIGDEWIWKSNGAGDSDVEAEKGALSDAFKRAAVMWGIGRYLYDVDSPWVQIEAMGRSFKIKDSEKPKLRAVLVRGHKPAPARNEPGEETPKARYIAEATAQITNAKTPHALGEWWNSDAEKEKRRFVDLSKTELDLLKSAVSAKLETLKKASAA